ncbi:phage major capsid protein [Agathobaculum sp. Marseille-P7918]|uniref:phage major capsid protein n=1 Tax=Agathobaculum sp. Marseille-P7918 TaxID=2479843 RepID=UPI000F63D0BA|nr:phage major capsid protein [Agathobaculum sp. Marseille-P7918]
MKKRLLDLQAKAKPIVERMKAADAAGDQAAFDAAQAELAPISAEIARVKALMQAEENATPEPQNAATAQGATGALVNSSECIHAFCECVRAGAAGDRTRYLQNADIVHRAVKNEGMTEGTPADGGLIVPSDIQTMIREQMRALNPLSELFSVENVSANTGSRVRDTAPTSGFTKVSEMGTISKDDKPAFAKVEYAVEDYALIVPVSNDLLKDTDQNLLAYLSRWLGKKAVITENKLLLTLLTALDGSATSIAEASALKTIKKLVNVTLDPIFGVSASFLTNQSGFNFLDSLEDGNGRPLLQVNPADRTQYMVGGRAVHVVSDAVLPNNTTAPLYVGDFMSFGTLFRRQAMEIASTNVGGNAWNTNSTEVRAITRLDAKQFDAAAVAAGKITLPGAG